MTKNEARKVIIKWLKDRDFQRLMLPENNGANCYIHSMGEYYTYVEFVKERFDESYNFSAGCYFDCKYGEATIRVLNLPSNPHVHENGFSQGFYYEEMDEQLFITLLNEMYDKYLKPYYEQGKKYLKQVLVKEKRLFKDDRYCISGGAREKLNQMFGLHVKFKP